MADFVKISDSISSDSSVVAASSKAVKLAYDLANSKQSNLGYIPVKTVNNTSPDNNGNVALVIPEPKTDIPSGTKMLFNQSAAPTGWTKQTSVDNAALRVVSGDTGGGTGGSIAFSTLFATGKAVSLSGNVGATTLTVAQMPSHNHTERGCTAYGKNASVSASEERGGEIATNTLTANTGSSSSHTHTLAGTATIALNVKYTDVIICAKD